MADDAPLDAFEAVRLLQTDTRPIEGDESQAAPSSDPEVSPPASVDRDGEPGAIDEDDEELNSAEEADIDTPSDEDQDTGVDEEAESDNQADDDLPPIDPPTSWAKTEKEIFQTLPREHQETIAARERSRDMEIRRVQNEAAEIRQKSETTEKAAEQARQQYETALPQMVNAIQNQMMAAFPDVQSWDDVQKMQAEDPIRYQEWDIQRQRVQAASKEAEQANQRAGEKRASDFQDYVKTETEKFLALAPEFGDPEKAPQLQSGVRAMFSDLGVTDDRLARLWNGQETISLRSSEAQLLVRDALRWRNAAAGRKNAKPKAVPPAQKPGKARTKTEVSSEQVRKADRQLSRSGSVEDAMALMRATGRA